MDKIIPLLKSAKALPGFQVELVYTDGIKGIVDLREGGFEYWNDELNFSKVFISESGAMPGAVILNLIH